MCIKFHAKSVPDHCRSCLAFFRRRPDQLRHWHSLDELELDFYDPDVERGETLEQGWRHI
jgi:hypothetical protein